MPVVDKGRGETRLTNRRKLVLQSRRGSKEKLGESIF